MLLHTVIFYFMTVYIFFKTVYSLSAIQQIYYYFSFRGFESLTLDQLGFKTVVRPNSLLTQLRQSHQLLPFLQDGIQSQSNLSLNVISCIIECFRFRQFSWRITSLNGFICKHKSWKLEPSSVKRRTGSTRGSYAQM